MSPSYRLPPARLEERFHEKHPPYDQGEARAEALRCLYCADAPCITACPTSIDIPTFIRKIATDNLRGSARTILDANLLGASCARVCPVEVLCEGSCVYTEWGRSPIAIGRLQRYAMDTAASPALLLKDKSPPSGFSVGLVGAGQASLACAGRLALLGHKTVLYEQGWLPGGLNASGVAPYKMLAARALEEVAFIQELGVTILTGIEIGRDISAGEMLEQHDAIFLGCGLGADSRLGVPGEDGAGVVGAVAWIKRMKTDPATSLAGIERAAVIGGGNTALDAARELVQLGVREVHLVYRRSESEMSGYRHEWEPAKVEGVELVPDAIVSGVQRDAGGKVIALQMLRAASGRATAEALPDLSVQLVVVAIGQARLAKLVTQFEGVALDDQGRIACDAMTGRTGNSRIFAGGDAANGGKEVVNAVDEGQRAAAAIHAMLSRAPTQRLRRT